MDKMTVQQLREYRLLKVDAFDNENPTGAYFVGWQDGFEPTIIEVQFDDISALNEQDAFEIAEEHMLKLNRCNESNIADFAIKKYFN